MALVILMLIQIWPFRSYVCTIRVSFSGSPLCWPDPDMGMGCPSSWFSRENGKVECQLLWFFSHPTPSSTTSSLLSILPVTVLPIHAIILCDITHLGFFSFTCLLSKFWHLPVLYSYFLIVKQNFIAQICHHLFIHLLELLNIGFYHSAFVFAFGSNLAIVRVCSWLSLCLGATSGTMLWSPCSTGSQTGSSACVACAQSIDLFIWSCSCLLTVEYFFPNDLIGFAKKGPLRRRMTAMENSIESNLK